MAVHQFARILRPPQTGERFDEARPQEYECIEVKDDLMDEILLALGEIPAFRQTTDWPAHGLDEAGITLIPPQSAGRMAEIIGSRAEFIGLCVLCSEACQTQTWLIHFGI